MQAQLGSRVSLRYRIPGGVSELVGWVAEASADQLVVVDRKGHPHRLTTADVLAGRQVGVPRGRDPRSADRAALDRIAAGHGLTGRCFVARLSDLLDAATPTSMDAPAPTGLHVDGEWASTGSRTDLVGDCWWASRHDARSIQVRTDDPDEVQVLLGCGFSELAA